jgi:hypothetical protein
VIPFEGGELRWEYNIKTYRYEIVYKDVSWIQIVQDRKHINKIMNIPFTKAD